jgi:prolipoprotein diacylglyceryltransferase
VRRNDPVVAGLTTAQLLSLAMIAAGVAWLATVRSRKGSLRAARADARPAEA